MNTSSINTSKRAQRIAVAAIFFLFGFCFASWASRIPAIQQKLGASDPQFGLILFALPVGLMVSLPISGWLVTKRGSKLIVSLAAICYSLVLITIGLAQSSLQLVLILFTFGLFGNMANIAVNTQAVAVEATYQRPIMATFHGVWSLAGFTAAALGTFMTGREIAPLFHFIIVTAISLLIFLIAVRYLVKADMASTKKQPLFVMPNKSLITLGLIAFCSMLCEGTMFDWSGIYFKKVVKPKEEWVGAGYTAFMCTMALSRFVADWFTAKFGFKRIVQCSGLIIMTGLLVSAIFPLFGSALVGFLLVGIGVSSIVPLVYSAAGRSKVMSPGLAIASVSTISFFGFLFGPPLIGLLAGASSLRLSFTVVAFIGLAVTLLATFYKDRE